MAKRKPIASINRPKRPRPAGAVAYLPVPFTGDAATQAQVPRGFVRFWPPGHPKHAVMVPMGPRGWRSPVDAGWDGVQRPFGMPIAAWRGMPPVIATVDVVFERWEDQDSVQPAWEILRGLANFGPNPVTGAGRTPPHLMVTRGAANSTIITPHDVRDRWVITTIDSDEDEDSVVRDANDRLIRMEAVVSLLYLPPGMTVLRDSATVIRKATPKPKQPKPYKSRAGDTLISIAGDKLHDRSRWPELQELNPKIRDPRAKIPEGTPIRLS